MEPPGGERYPSPHEGIKSPSLVCKPATGIVNSDDSEEGSSGSFEAKVSTKLPTGDFEKLTTFLEDSVKSLTIATESGEGGINIPPFRISKNEDNGYTIDLPSNIESFGKFRSIQVLIGLLNDSNFTITNLGAAITLYEDKESDAFFLAFYTEFKRPLEDLKFSFKGANASQRGTSSARLHILRTFLDRKGVPEMLSSLPSCLYLEAKDKKEYFPYYTHRLGGKGKNDAVSALLACFKKAIAVQLTGIAWENFPNFASYSVPFGSAISGLHRTKSVVDKKTRVAKLVSLTPNRPSGRIEVLTEAENSFLLSCENAFTRYEELVSKHKTKGVLWHDFKAVRKEANSLIAAQWETIGQVSPKLSFRTKALGKLISKEIGKKADITKNNISVVLALISEHPDEYVDEIRELSPYHLVAFAQAVRGEKRAHEQKVKVVHGNVTITGPTLKNHQDFELYEDFFEQVGLGDIFKEVRKPPSTSGHEDEEDLNAILFPDESQRENSFKDSEGKRVSFPSESI